MEKVKVFVSGCTDKLGHRIVDLVNQHPYWEVCGGFGRKKNQYKFPVFDANTDLEQAKKFFGSEKPNLIFNVPTSKVAKNASFDFAFNFKVPSVIETSNLSYESLKYMQSQLDIPVFGSYNFLTSMRDFTKRVCDAAVSLPGYNINITESHHSRKSYAPSGTANDLAFAIEAALGYSCTIISNPDYNKPRGKNEIYVTSIRCNDNIGTHTVTFACDGEIQEYTHRVTSKDMFAKGALKAAEFLLEQKPGYYNINNLK